MNLIIVSHNEENCSESIIRGIGFHDQLSIGNLMSKNQSSYKCLLERIEEFSTVVIKIPRSVFF